MNEQVIICRVALLLLYLKFIFRILTIVMVSYLKRFVLFLLLFFLFLVLLFSFYPIPRPQSSCFFICSSKTWIKAFLFHLDLLLFWLSWEMKSFWRWKLKMVPKGKNTYHVNVAFVGRSKNVYSLNLVNFYFILNLLFWRFQQIKYFQLEFKRVIQNLKE